MGAINLGSDIRTKGQYQSKYNLKDNIKNTPGSLISSKIGIKQGKMRDADFSNPRD